MFKDCYFFFFLHLTNEIVIYIKFPDIKERKIVAFVRKEEHNKTYICISFSHSFSGLFDLVRFAIKAECLDFDLI